MVRGDRVLRRIKSDLYGTVEIGIDADGNQYQEDDYTFERITKEEVNRVNARGEKILYRIKSDAFGTVEVGIDKDGNYFEDDDYTCERITYEEVE